MNNQTLTFSPEFVANSAAAATAQMVDMLGRINAEMAEMGAQAKMLKAELQARIEAGDAAEGADFRASHALQNRSTVDWKAVAAKLNPSRQLVSAHTKTAEVHVIKVSGRVANAA